MCRVMVLGAGNTLAGSCALLGAFPERRHACNKAVRVPSRDNLGSMVHAIHQFSYSYVINRERERVILSFSNPFEVVLNFRFANIVL